MSEITGILLAAGKGLRFGADKLIQPVSGGDWLAVEACRRLQAGVDRVFAVIRPDSDALAARLEVEGAVVAVCPKAELGMGHSLAFAINGNRSATGVVVALADMPWVAPASIGAVADALRQGAMLAAPVYQGRRGHPVGFSAQLFPQLAALTGDAGAKSLVHCFQHQIQLIPVSDPGILLDVDQPTDLLSNHDKADS